MEKNQKKPRADYFRNYFQENKERIYQQRKERNARRKEEYNAILEELEQLRALNQNTEK